MSADGAGSPKLVSNVVYLLHLRSLRALDGLGEVDDRLILGAALHHLGHLHGLRMVGYMSCPWRRSRPRR